jgi:hypothetical protein
MIGDLITIVATIFMGGFSIKMLSITSTSNIQTLRFLANLGWTMVLLLLTFNLIEKFQYVP